LLYSGTTGNKSRSTSRAEIRITLGEELSRKGAKAQSATAFLRVFFAPLRLCAFAREKMFSHRDLQR
jgi:hypothetical protein